ncbi:MAG: hypothetical protein HGA19_08985 [Oscillochloris sp.]|nr:hypothetical protein [Oscillochloris sp.]
MYYADFDAGTFLLIDGLAYGPQPVANRGFHPIPYTQINQEGSGSGTAADPFVITTEVAAGDTGIRLIQTVSYVSGDYSYDLYTRVENDNSSVQSVALINAADLYANFPDNRPDYGYGFYEPITGAVGLLSLGLQNIQSFIPDPNTPADAYQVSAWGGSNYPFWSYIGGSDGVAGPGLQNFVDPGYYDVVAGLQWNLTVPAAVNSSTNSTAALTPGSIQVGSGGGFGTPDQVGIPQPSNTTSKRYPKAAKVSVVQRTSPSIAATPSGIINYTIVAANHGKGAADNVTIKMPIDSANVKVLDASFSREGAWISNLTDDSLEIKTGKLNREGDIITTTVRLQVLPTVAPSTSLSNQLSYHWSDDVEGGDGTSNTTILTVENSENNAETYPLNAALSSNETGTSLTFSSAIFAPKEPVGIWYNAPDGSVIPGATFFAEADGSLTVSFDSTGLQPGNYTAVFYGHWTEFTAVAPFTIQ